MTKRCYRQSAHGFSLIEIMIVVAIILVIASIAIPKVYAAYQNALETGATRAIATIHTAQAQYLSQFGKYAPGLQELGPPTSGNPGPGGADLIGPDLATGTKGGYRFTIALAPEGYTVSAVPATYKSTGRRTFYSDQTLIIREHWGPEPATVQSKPL